MSASIECLPNEIISILLKNNGCRDILRFGATCKRFNELVKGNQNLWKETSRRTLPTDIYQVINEHCDGDWLKEVKEYFIVHQQVTSELILMSPKYFWHITYDFNNGEQKIDIRLEDVRNFFAIALSSKYSYYYVINTLQDIINKGHKMAHYLDCCTPYTMTEMYYAKVILRYMIHTYLAIKWVKQHLQNKLTPEMVINFFMQWIDIIHLYQDEDINKIIEEVIDFARNIMDKKYKSRPGTVQEKIANGTITGIEIHDAVAHAVYRHQHMSVTSAANMDTLDIAKVIECKCGNIITAASVYQTVARRFGVYCELIAFPNHLFLEWREPGTTNVYTVDMTTGELRPKRRCPFSFRSQNDPGYKYCPDSLLQYVYSSFSMTMGALRNWNTQNAAHLLDFLDTNHVDQHVPYRNFLPYLLDQNQIPRVLNTPLNIKCLSAEHLDLLKSLANLNTAVNAVPRPKMFKKHDSRVKFAVGMICYHKNHDYVCIIRNWDTSCAPEWLLLVKIDTLQYGHDQPFYNVVVADQSERYIAQENLLEVGHPTRLYHLEDIIAREFTHYNGYAYVPNEQKKLTYPDDFAISEMYRARAQNKPSHSSRCN